MTSIPIHHVTKVWGSESWIVNDAYCGKILRINPGWRCSLHFHPIKDETFYVLEGLVLLERDDELLELRHGSVARITPGTPHRFASGLAAMCAVILEISTHHDDEDVVRLEPSGLIKPIRARDRELSSGRWA